MANRTRGRRATGHTASSHHALRQHAPADDERSLLDAIAEGVLDDHLVAIAAAADARLRLLHTIDSSHALAALCVGDRVRINARVRPRYLAALDGTVIELDDHSATVQLDYPVGRFESGRVRFSPLALQKLRAAG